MSEIGKRHHVDALIIGAGAGGLFVAALLARAGYRVLVTERLDCVGGRASTRYKEGFAVNTGALGIEWGTETEQVFNRIGAKLDLRTPRPGVVVRLGRRDLNVTNGLNGLLARGATHLLKVALALIKPLRPAPDESTYDWVARFTRNATAHGVLRNFVGSIFATTPQSLPAALFLRYYTTKGAFKSYGFPPGGTVRVWDTLLEAYQRDGGELWLDAEVKRLTFNTDGSVAGAIIVRDGREVEAASRFVVSDVGPFATLALCGAERLPADYAARVRAANLPSAIITLYFASRTPLARSPGFTCFSATRRLCYSTYFTPMCPENSPPGWHFYCGASVPRPAVGEFDEAAEIELLKADLREQFPGFDQARIVDIVVTKGDWPAQRAVAGADLPHATPIANLWHVGDGVKEWGSAATSACAETALIVSEKIAAAYPQRNT